MRVAFRVDAALWIGTGHVMRCLTLAGVLSGRGAEVVFVCRRLPGSLESLIENRGYTVVVLPAPEDLDWSAADLAQQEAQWSPVSPEADARDTVAVLGNLRPIDWLVVDHYALPACWHATLRPWAFRLMVIDDLADRVLDADLVLDQTYGRSVAEYRSLVPESCEILVGARYALLRPEFRDWRETSLQRSRPQQRGRLQVLVSLGGTDGHGFTTQVLCALDGYDRADTLSVTVIMGKGAPHLDSVREVSKRLGVDIEVRAGATNMAELMAHADIAIGAAGATSWERCCLGVPTLMLVIAENQRTIAANLMAAGAAVVVDPSDDIQGLHTVLDQALDDTAFLMTMSEKAAAIVDGRGANRVVEVMSRYARPSFKQMKGIAAPNSQLKLNSGSYREVSAQNVHIRPMVWGDVEKVFQWQSKAGARSYSRNPEPPTWTEHLAWWEARWSQYEVVDRIVETQGAPIGFLRLDPIRRSEEWEVSILIDPAIKGRGYGKAALVRLCQEFWDRDLVAEVAEANHASQRLFESVGFERVGPTRFCLRAPHIRP